MNVTETTRQVLEYHITLTAEEYAAIAPHLADLATPAPNGNGHAAPKARKVHRAAAHKTVGPKGKGARGRQLTASGLTKVACPMCGKKIAEKYLPLHQAKKHSSTAMDSAIAAA